MIDESSSRAPAISALLPCRVADTSWIAETLLSLAAQTSCDFDVHIIAEDGSPSDLSELRALVRTFDEGFSRRVHVAAMEHASFETPFTFALERSRAAYVATLSPNDVVFAHWAETFVSTAPRAGGRAMSSLVALQRVDDAMWGDVWIVTTVERPRCLVSGGFDFVEHLASGPVDLRGFALPRLALRDGLPRGIPPAAEGWAVRLAVALTCGMLETGVVTYLRRPVSPERSGLEHAWSRDRDAALELLDRGGLALAPGTLRSVLETNAHPSLTRLEAEGELLRAQLRRANEATLAHAEAEAAALRRMAELQSSTSWRASAPLRALGDAARRLRRRAPHNPGQ